VRILSIDTSTRIQALGLVEDGRQLARRHHIVRINHAATLLHNISDMLEQHRWSMKDIDLVGVGIGPGSFTGLRVGLANAKALARAAHAHIAGISSLDALARPACDIHDGLVVAAIDARRSEVYSATYRGDGSGAFEKVVEARTIAPEELSKHIRELEGRVLVIGNGIRSYANDLDHWRDERIRSLSNGWDSPSPFSIAMMAHSRLESEDVDDLITLEPNYIRLSDAEIAWRERPSSS